MESDDGFLEVSYHKNTNCDIPIPPRPPSRTTSLASEPENQTIVRDENDEPDLQCSPFKSAPPSSDTFPTTAISLPHSTEAGSQKDMAITKDTDASHSSSGISTVSSVTKMELDATEKDLLNNNNQNCRISSHATESSSPVISRAELHDNTKKPTLGHMAAEDGLLKDQGKTHSSERRLKVDLEIDENETLSEDLKRSESIEELDSPESISKIDREDCFSWEEDRIVLEINDEHDPKSDCERSPCIGSGNSTDPSTATTTTSTSNVVCDKNARSHKVEVISELPGNTAGLIHPTADSSCEMPLKNSPTTLTQSKENTAEDPLLPSEDSHQGSKKKPSSLNIESNSLEDGIAMTTTLQADEYGLPLAIFSKVCKYCFL